MGEFSALEKIVICLVKGPSFSGSKVTVILLDCPGIIGSLG